MSKRLIFIFFTLGTFLGIVSCKKPPDWPNVPVITQNENTEYIESASGFDTIKIHVAFQDGDGNLGLEADGDSLEPFQAYDIVKDGNGNPIFFDNSQTFNIYTHEVTDLDGDDDLDTFRVKRNLYRNNIFFSFIRYNQLGNIIDTLNFKELGDYGLEGFNGRFEPLFKKDFTDEVYEGPIEGVIDYRIVSAFSSFDITGNGFPKGTYRIGVKIVDRDLNISNEVITSPAIEIE